ncbi:TPA: type II toxin-antitoxin system prevent-host-death family antitoxin [Acinetobacter baumannii]|nr:type II toxin-antitoxin system prevent-host-death family antitoxin [Acinetobacter baumannii]HEB4103577.1 type II toxin-antitoxin system prevent-host-death family antitoxin [Acinetobacter baumannii]HEB4107666.1 type II toxin-antitoxin system prevent-host-death family antitoxin [Acinetobacter baumannii]HEG4462071.1 type II toxin-antitoxin system prevent-host-death family antitoxin [Acinetobacter baumannii]
MQILNFSQARACFKEVMEDVCRDHEPTVITRQSGNPVVVISLEDFNGMQETMYLLSSTKNSKRLLESVARIKAGQTKKRDLIQNDCQTETT